MAKRIRYYYDEESCSFKPEENTPRRVIVNVSKYVGGSLVLAFLMISALFFFYDNPKEAHLKSLISDLESKFIEQNNMLTQLEGNVDSLHKKDNDFYRSLLGTSAINEGIWNGGIGGADYADPNEPQALRETEERLDRIQNKVSIQNKSYISLLSDLSNKTEELKHIPAIKPVPGRVISGFGMRMHPIKNFRRMHWGLDMQATTGTPVHAAGDGVIKLAKVSRGGYGKQVEIKHGEFGYVTKYAHLSKIIVKKGEKVERGQIIGYSGNTGLSKGPHLHYEIFKDEKRINPIDYFYGDLTPEEYVKLREEAKVDNMSMD
ncbi:MAG: M23 family metallopeptidase [Bacteroidota bacterium]